MAAKKKKKAVKKGGIQIAYVDHTAQYERAGQPIRQFNVLLNRKKRTCFKDLPSFEMRNICSLDADKLQTYKPDIVIFDPAFVRHDQLKDYQNGKDVTYIAYSSDSHQDALDDQLYNAHCSLKKNPETGVEHLAQAYKCAIEKKDLPLEERMFGYNQSTVKEYMLSLPRKKAPRSTFRRPMSRGSGR